MRRFLIALIFALLSPGLLSAQNVTVVRHVPPEESIDIRKLYFYDLLRLALDKSEPSFGPYKMEQAPVRMYQSRAIKSLKSDKFVDVIWTMTSKPREKELRPIRIPLMKGMLGFRVMIINQVNQDAFEEISSLNELASYTAIQGHDWPDTKILRHNGLTVVDDYKYLALFERIDLDRYDYFPRGVLEADEELRVISHRNLIVDQHLMLVYPAPIYFFVNNKNILLAKRIEMGLRMALADGSFDELLIHHPAHIATFKSTNWKDRRVLKLENTLLPARTPILEELLWFDFNELEGIKALLNNSGTSDHQD